MERFPSISLQLLLATSLAVAFVASQEFDDVPRAASPGFGDGWHTGGLLDFTGSQGFFWPHQLDSAFREGSNFGIRQPSVEHIPVKAEESEKPNRDTEPLDVEYISGSMGNPDDTQVQVEDRPPFKPSYPSFIPGFGVGGDTLFQHTFDHFPGFSNFFNGFNYQSPHIGVWWRGPNVCTEKQEDVEDWDKHLFSGLSLNFESCVEKSNKHICKTISNRDGQKYTVTVTHMCCHGYERTRDGRGTSCKKVDLHSVEETAESLGAKEFITSTKNNGLSEKITENITMFVPLDSAFTDFSEKMFESNLVVLPLSRSRRATKDVSGITTRELALAHIVDGFIRIEDISNEQLLTTSYENSTIRMNIFPRPPNYDSYDFRYTANCAPLLKVNKIATNGIVHVVERVLPPVTQSILEQIEGRSDMTILRTVLQKTELDKLLSQEGKSFTLFAPTDSAFDKLEPHLKRTIKEGNGCATNILKNHILDLTFCSCAVVDTVMTNTYNLLDQKMIFERVDGKQKSGEEEQSEVVDMAGVKEILVNGLAKITEADLMATNGVIHVIDAVIPTESGMPITSMLTTQNLTTFKRLLEASGREEEFEMMTNVSFFVPTDKALQDSRWVKELDENPDSLKDNEDLVRFLNYHVGIPLIKTCDLNDDMVHTKSGDDLRVNLYATHPVFSNVMNRATVNCARLIHFDDESCGSVLHQVDKVLEPPTKSLLEILDTTEKYSKWLDFVRAANLTNLLEDVERDYTIMVPTNEVFREQREWYEEKLAKPEEAELIVKNHMLPDVLCCAGIVPSEWPFVRTIESLSGRPLRIDRGRRPVVANAGITKCDVVAKNGVLHEINDVIIPKERQRTPVSSFFW